MSIVGGTMYILGVTMSYSYGTMSIGGGTMSFSYGTMSNVGGTSYGHSSCRENFLSGKVRAVLLVIVQVEFLH